MTYPEALSIVEEAIKYQFDIDPEEYTLEARVEKFGDSLDLVEVTIRIEEKIGEVFPKDLGQYKTVNDLVNFVMKYNLKYEGNSGISASSKNIG